MKTITVIGLLFIIVMGLVILLSSFGAEAMSRIQKEGYVGIFGCCLMIIAISWATNCPFKL